MARWFRFYDEALDDPKVQSLPGETFKLWVNVLCIASRSDGLIAISELPFRLRKNPKEIERHVTAIRAAGLLDEKDDTVTPHNWHGRQYASDSSAERMRRHRDGHRAVTVTANAPSPVQNSDAAEQIQSRADTEQNREERTRAVRASPPSWELEFSQFWAAYPRHDDRKRAFAAYGKALKAAEHPVILAAAQRYCQDPNREAPFTKQAATWLNNQSWENGPLPGQNVDPEAIKREVDVILARDRANGHS